MIFFKKYRQPFRPPWPRIEKTTSKNVVFSILETRTGVEPVNVGFADRCVTASPPGQTVAHFTLSFIVLISKPNSVLGWKSVGHFCKTLSRCCERYTASVRRGLSRYTSGTGFVSYSLRSVRYTQPFQVLSQSIRFYRGNSLAFK